MFYVILIELYDLVLKNVLINETVLKMAIKNVKLNVNLYFDEKKAILKS